MLMPHLQAEISLEPISEVDPSGQALHPLPLDEA
jgi:hypothetical protein